MRQSICDLVDFTVTCPEVAEPNSPVHDIRARGNLPLVLDHDMVIELKRCELLENWRATCTLGRARLDKLVQETASRITAALEDDEPTDMPSLAMDTAAFFLLALRQKGVKYPCNIASCQVSYVTSESGGKYGQVVIN